jgi:SAM-dependent methyltransferase
MVIHCPLDATMNARLIERISTDSLASVFEKSLGFSIRGDVAHAPWIEFYVCQTCSLGFFNPSLVGSEDFYRELSRFSWYYLNDKAEYAYARTLIKPGDAILDVGCGSGAFARRLCGNKYVGLELSRSASQQAVRQGVEVVSETIEAHAARNRERYDIVCAFQVLEHVTNLRDFVRASLDCVKPGGLLLYSVPNTDGFISLVPNNVLNLPPHHVTWWSTKSLEHLAKCFGVELFAIEHEILDEIHRRLYAVTLMYESLRNFVGVERRLLDTSITSHLLRKASGLAARLLEKGLIDLRARPLGHSVTAVYRK